MNFRSKQKTQA